MTKATILVCDDEPTMRELLRVILAEEYDVFEAADGREALELAKAAHPDIILLDLMLPEISGLDVLARLRQEDVFGDPGVIVLTALRDAAASAAEGGADRFLLKPFEIGELQSAIEEVVAERRRR